MKPRSWRTSYGLRSTTAQSPNSKPVTMGTECIMATLNEDPEPSFPPGFGPFVLRSIQSDVKPVDIHSSSMQALQCIEEDANMLEPNSAHCRSGTPASTSGSCRKSLRNRPPIDYSLFDLTSDDESGVESAEKGVRSMRRRQQLPKGVVRGCAECADCQKVVARWKPSGARRPVLEEAPVYYPSEEEFKDTLKYIESIRSTAEPYGICRIVPPPSWKPSCLLKEKNIWECSKFPTRVQKVDKLQNRKSSKKSRRGGMMKKRRKLSDPEDIGNVDHNQTVMQQNQERFGFEPGPEFTLQTFKKYADDFSDQYFNKDTFGESVPSVEDIEGEYWRIVERPTEEIEVIYGADLESGTFGSGFPKFSAEVKSDVEHKYAESGWNLNNLPRLQGSVLSFEDGDISGVLIPWVYVGMCFSSFCWHVEDHHLYSLNYMHWGAPKMWYGVPGKDAVNLEAAMRKHLPDLFEEQPDLLHNLDAVELYREQARKITISHDKLLLGAAREAIRAQWDILFLKRNTADNLRWKSMCGPDSAICKSLKKRSGNKMLNPGFRSRVKYFSIVDPTQMAYYISQILDGGLHGPLFMVSLENCPGEVFINVSPAKCWSMAIEARDRDRICTEYWRSRPHVVAGDHDRWHMPPSQGPPHIALRGLFQRASRDELQALRSLLTSNSSLDESSRQQAAQILDEEIAKQWHGQA
nr:unnamed protein product [Digitaria exilis]